MDTIGTAEGDVDVDISNRIQVQCKFEPTSGTDTVRAAYWDLMHSMRPARQPSPSTLYLRAHNTMQHMCLALTSGSLQILSVRTGEATLVSLSGRCLWNACGFGPCFLKKKVCT